MTPSERALRDGVAVIGSIPRAVYAVTGEHSLAYLHDVVAQDVSGLTPGRGALAAVLDAGGRVVAEIRVMPRDGDVLLDGEPAIRPGVEAHIARHAPLAGCAVADVTQETSVAAIRGPETDAALVAAGIGAPTAEEASFVADGDLLIVRVLWGLPGVDLIGPPDVVAEAAARVDGERATIDELNAALVGYGRPRYGVDITDELLVNETPLLTRGVSMTKGCYPGQESVARIANLGRVRRSVRGLRASWALTPGSAVVARHETAGRVTSVAHPSDDGWKALAILRDIAAPGDTVEVDGVEAVVVDLE